jgi:hypothetical protein
MASVADSLRNFGNYYESRYIGTQNDAMKRALLLAIFEVRKYA